MPLIKSKSKKAMSENIKKEMDSGKPQKQAVAIAYSVMRKARKNKMAQGGLSDPEKEKQVSEMKIEDHFPTYDSRKGPDEEGYERSQDPVEPKPHTEGPNTDLEDESLQQHMRSFPADHEDRGHTLFDGDAERKDPLQLEFREDEQSEHYGRRDLDEEDADADDIVSRIMRKMRRK